MSDKKIRNYHLRASIPAILRYAGIAGSVIAIISVSIGFYLASSEKEFRSGDFPGALSQKIVGVIDGYERKAAENGVVKYFVTADKATTFDDGHQELDSINLQLFKNGDVEVFDRVSSDRAIYVPEGAGNDFTIFFAGNVEIRTSSGLDVNTDQLSYRSETDVAKAEELVSFGRLNISGKSYGALMDIGKKTIELSKDVKIIATGAEYSNTGSEDQIVARLRAGYAFIEGDNESIRLRDGVAIALKPGSETGLKQPSDIRSSNAHVYLEDREIRRIELNGDVDVKQNPTQKEPNWIRARSQRAVALVNKSIERLSLFDGLTIESHNSTGNPVFAKSDSGDYEKSSELFELNDSVEILTNRGSGSVRASGARAVYRQIEGEILLQGGAEVSQGDDLIRGDSIFAELNETNQLKYAKATDNAYLKQIRNGRVTKVNSEAMRAWFSVGQKLSKADGRGKTLIDVLPAEDSDYSRFRLSAPKGIDLGFNGSGFLSSMSTIGRTTLHLDAGSSGKAAADKTLTADQVKTSFRKTGNELAKAHAVGNAELVVIPRKRSAGEYRSRVSAPRFDCEFFPGNNARICTSNKRSKLVRKALWEKRNDQQLEANQLVSHFDRETRDVKLFESVGKAKFLEGAKNGIAERIDHSPSDNSVSLRGGNPTVWDAKARARAVKIDWNTDLDSSVLKGGVSTTYFNQKETGDAAPFTEKKSPVFLTSELAKFDHRKRTAVYIGNARAWQDKNYVRGDRIYIEEVAGRFFAEGKVRSMIYEAKSAADGEQGNSPVFVSSDTMLYLREGRQVRYEKNVDMRQGTERIVADAADIFLKPDNSLLYSIITGNVVITQPNRKGTGNWVKYDAVSETIELRGNPATYSDSESGSSNGKLITVDLKTNRAVNSGSTTKTGTGRTRSVYKVKEGRLN